MNTLNESMRVAYEIGVTEEEFGLSVSWWDIEQIYKAGMAAERDRIFEEAKHIIKKAEARGAAVEREACAKLCEEQYEYYGHDHVFAAKIRARGNQ